MNIIDQVERDLDLFGGVETSQIRELIADARAERILSEYLIGRLADEIGSAAAPVALEDEVIDIPPTAGEWIEFAMAHAAAANDPQTTDYAEGFLCAVSGGRSSYDTATFDFQLGFDAACLLGLYGRWSQS